MFVNAVVAVALLASFTAAATSANSTIDPNSVDLSTRSSWCQGEISTCGILCSGDIDGANNICDPNTLNFTCLCAANDSTPGLQYYKQSMPTFICEQIYQNCIVAGENDAAAQKLCTTAEQTNCGQLDPTNFTAAVVSSSSSSSASATATPTESASQTSASTTASTTAGSSAANAVMLGREYGVGVIAAGIAAAFGFML
ncbi:hypothetical protein B7494_g3774 [Chlorociboria aeruginascens]|nr:hypothetical protein B7494_g3774 [Chlorociboria aeruginascens]